ncbi:hypothetical protein D3C83_123540 [compost metagenome]
MKAVCIQPEQVIPDGQNQDGEGMIIAHHVGRKNLCQVERIHKRVVADVVVVVPGQQAVLENRDIYEE